VIAGSATAELLVQGEAEQAEAAATAQYTANDRGNVAVDARGSNGAGAVAATSDSGVAVTAITDIGDAISASTGTGVAVYASSGGVAAVYAYGGEPQVPNTPDRENQVTNGVYAIGGGYPTSAIRAQGRSGYGILATNSGDTACIYADARHGTGLEARSKTNNAILATSRGDAETVHVDNRGPGPGIISTSTFGPGVTGISSHGPGVVGKSASSDTAAVHGENSSQGYGGVFKGGRAPLRLVPQFSSTGFPSSGDHARGELFADTAGNLWYCVAGGSPGRWRKVLLG